MQNRPEVSETGLLLEGWDAHVHQRAWNSLGVSLSEVDVRGAGGGAASCALPPQPASRTTKNSRTFLTGSRVPCVVVPPRAHGSGAGTPRRRQAWWPRTAPAGCTREKKKHRARTRRSEIGRASCRERV